MMALLAPERVGRFAEMNRLLLGLRTAVEDLILEWEGITNGDRDVGFEGPTRELFEDGIQTLTETAREIKTARSVSRGAGDAELTADPDPRRDLREAVDAAVEMGAAPGRAANPGSAKSRRFSTKAPWMRGRYHVAPRVAMVPPARLQQAVDFAAVGAYIVKNHFRWVLGDRGLRNIILEEIAMLRYHARDGASSSGGLLGNSYFSLAAQLLWADPLTWLYVHRVAPSHPVHMLIRPRPLRVLTEGCAPPRYYEGGSGSRAGSGHMCAEVLLDEGGLAQTLVSPQDFPALEGFLASLAREESYVDLASDALSGAFAGFAGSFARAGIQEVDIDLGPSDLAIRRSGTVVSWKGGEGAGAAPDGSRISVPLSFVAVENGVCHGDASLEALQTAHRELSVPGGGPAVFPASVRLEGLGAIFDMLRGTKDLAHPMVRAEMERWLEYDGSPRCRPQHTLWKARAKLQVQEAWKLVRAAEMGLFEGARSYFRRAEERLERPLADAPLDDEAADAI